MLTKGPSTPPQDPDPPPTVAQTPPTTSRGSTRTRGDTDPGAPKSGQAGASAFVGAIQPWVDVLQADAPRLQKAFDDLVNAHQRVARQAADRQRDELTSLDGRMEVHKRTAATAGKELNDAVALIDKLQSEQPKELAFIDAHAADLGLADGVAAARKAWQDAQQQRTKADEEYRALAARYYDAETDDARASLEDQVEEARKNFEAAQEAEQAASETLTTKRAELQATRRSLVDAFKALPAAGEHADKIRAAWNEVLKRRAQIEAAEAKADEIDARIASLNDDLEKTQADVSRKEQIWKDIHDEALRVSKAATEAADKYQKFGGKENREKAEALIEQRDKLRDKDRAAKDEMNEARRAATDLQKKIKLVQKESETAAGEVAKVQAEAEGVIQAANAKIKAVAEVLVPLEQARVDRLTRARQARDDADQRKSRADAALGPLQKQRDSVEDTMRTYTRHVTEMESYMLESMKEPLGADINKIADALKAIAQLKTVPAEKAFTLDRKAEDVQKRLLLAQTTVDSATLRAELKDSLGTELGAWRTAYRDVTRVLEEVRGAASAIGRPE
jgi:chromosome segregation ATPase